MVENFDKMLAGSLRLEDPWYIIGAEFNEEEPALAELVEECFGGAS